VANLALKFVAFIYKALPRRISFLFLSNFVSKLIEMKLLKVTYNVALPDPYWLNG